MEPPLTDSTLPPKESSIIPKSGESFTTLPPIGIPGSVDHIYEKLTTPEIPESPTFAIGCSTNDNCFESLTCYNKLCIDVCSPGLCGKNAKCITVHHRPICKCPPGTTGNPTIKCTGLATHIHIFEEPVVGHAQEIIDDIIDPSKTQPSTSLPPVTDHSTDYKTETPTVIVPVLPPIVQFDIACQNNDDCDASNSCINQLCAKSCSLSMCGANSDCFIHQHRPVCICPPGTSGDPLQKCYSLEIDVVTTKRPISEELLKIPSSEIKPISIQPPKIPEPVTDLPPIPSTVEPYERPTPFSKYSPSLNWM